MRFNTSPSQRLASTAESNRFAVSEDGYIRLSFAELQAVHLSHLISGLDEDTPAASFDGATSTAIRGYTEWVSHLTPALTIGWDWQMEAAHHYVLLRRIGEPRSNIMLLNAYRKDLSQLKTDALLEAFVDSLKWQTEVKEHIGNRYTQ